jgi:hypothetical protein
MDIKIENLFFLYVKTDKVKAIQFLDFCPNVNFGHIYDVKPLRDVLLTNFYPEILSYPKIFKLDSNRLFNILQSRFMYDIGLFQAIRQLGDANLLSDENDDNKLNYMKLFTRQLKFINLGHINKNDIAECLIYIRSLSFDFDYVKILTENLAADSANYSIFEICEENGVTLSVLGSVFVKNFVEEISNNLCSEIFNKLCYLLEHQEEFPQEIDVRKLFYAASKHEKIIGNSDFWEIFIQNGLSLESDADIMVAFSWINKAVNVVNILDFIVGSIAYDESKHKKFAIEQIHSCRDSFIEKLRAYKLIDIDYVEQLQTYCVDPNFETEFPIEYVNNYEIKKIIPKPFGYQTQREFELYLKLRADQFAYDMIKSGFKPSFETRPNEDMISAIRLLVEYYGADKNLFEFSISGDLPELETVDNAKIASAMKKYMSEAFDIHNSFGVKRNKKTIDKIFTEINNITDDQSTDCAVYENLLHEIKHNINNMKQVLMAIFGTSFQTKALCCKNHVDICLNIFKTSHDKSQIKAILIAVILQVFEYCTQMQLEIYRKIDDKITKTFKSYIEEYNIDFMTEIVAPLLQQPFHKRSSRVILLAAKIFNSGQISDDNMEFRHFLISSEALGIGSMDYLLASVLNSYKFSNFVLPAAFIVSMFALNEELGYLDDKQKCEKILKTFIYKRMFVNLAEMQNLCQKISAHFPNFDCTLITNLKTKSAEHLINDGWFTNKAFCEYVLTLIE